MNLKYLLAIMLIFGFSAHMGMTNDEELDKDIEEGERRERLQTAAQNYEVAVQNLLGSQKKYEELITELSQELLAGAAHAFTGAGSEDDDPYAGVATNLGEAMLRIVDAHEEQAQQSE